MIREPRSSATYIRAGLINKWSYGGSIDSLASVDALCDGVVRELGTGTEGALSEAHLLIKYGLLYLLIFICRADWPGF
jgi:hypothetical protein